MSYIPPDTVVSLFDYTGTAVLPWLEAGYKAITIDLKPSELTHPNHIHYQLDLTTKPNISASVAFLIAFPPCTHLAISGSRHFQGKGLRKLQNAIACFATAQELAEELKAPYVIENPVSTISTYWRKPDYSFHPYEYDQSTDNYTKKTCIWVGNGFILPPKLGKPATNPDKDYITNNKARRDRTPEGFARALYRANAKHFFYDNLKPLQSAS